MANPKQPACHGDEKFFHPSKRIKAELRIDINPTTLKCLACGVILSNTTNHP